MSHKLLKKRSKKAGLPPGSLVHIGERRAGLVRVSVVRYNAQAYEERTFESLEALAEAREWLLAPPSPEATGETATWVHVDGLHEVEILARLGEWFNLHPLVLEDILNTDQRPKLEDYGDHLYLVLKMLYDAQEETPGQKPLNNRGQGVHSEQISLVLGRHYLLSFQEHPSALFEPIRERIRTGKFRLRSMGADYLLYSLIDTIVDHYYVILEQLGEKIELVEEQAVNRPEPRTLQTIHNLRREMIFLRKSVWPLREVAGTLSRHESVLIDDNMALYLRDVYDHTIHVIDTVETLRDIVAGMLDIYLSSVSNRMNMVMKFLTAIATVFIPLTFIVGIYGMNFDYMPELHWRWGYPAVMFSMAFLSVTMLGYFKKKGWL